MIEQAVAPSDLLALLSPPDLRDLRAIGSVRTFRKRQLIFRAGDVDPHVYFLERGHVKIYEYSTLGREVILWFCLPGEIFGLAEVAQGGARAVIAQACEESTVLVVPQIQILQYFSQHPQAALFALQALASRLRVLGHMLSNLVSDDVNVRLVKLILRLSARYGTRRGRQICLDIPLTHQEIADMIGTTRPTVSNALGRLKRQGLLRIDRHKIRIESEELLARMIR